MAVGFPPQIQAICLRKLRGVTVGSANAQGDQRTGRQGHAANLAVLQGSPIAQLIGRLKAQKFVHSQGKQLLLGGRILRRVLQALHQGLALFGPLVQTHQGIANQVGGGLMPGIQKEDAVLVELHLAQALALHFALNQPGQHIPFRIAGVLAATCHQPFQVVDKVQHVLVRTGLLFGRQRGLQGAQNGKRPLAQRAALIRRYAQQVANDLDRNGRGKVFDQVTLAARFQSVQKMVDPLRQPRCHVGNGPSGERAHDQLAHARVQRRVVEHQAGGMVREQGRAHAILGAKLDLLVRTEHLRVAVDRHHIVVAREQPAAIGHATHRRVAAQCVVHRVGVVVERPRQGAQIQRLRNGLRLLKG